MCEIVSNLANSWGVQEERQECPETRIGDGIKSDRNRLLLFEGDDNYESSGLRKRWLRSSTNITNFNVSHCVLKRFSDSQEAMSLAAK
jgi:hypothetical protein